jgi:hypothetical protein
MSEFEGKSIMVLMPPDVGIHAEIGRNLRQLGFDVKLITGQPEAFRYRGLGERLSNLLHKVVGDHGYKRRLILSHMSGQVDRSIDEAGRVDYVLVIRADCFTHAQLEAALRNSGRCYGYHWDGLGRFPGIEERLRYFRKFYVFDPADAQPTEGVEHADNFWFDRIAGAAVLAKPDVDVYYVGTYDGRAPLLLGTFERLRRHGQKVRAILAGRNPGPRPSIAGVTFPEEGITYSENLDLLPSARIILDMPHLDVHQGLSLRVFEALGSGKKLITTNPHVLRCDFYHPDNIHLLTDDDASLARFLSVLAVPVASDLRLRHGFSAWLRRVLEMEGG